MSSFNQDTRQSIVVAGGLYPLSRRTYNQAKIALPPAESLPCGELIPMGPFCAKSGGTSE